MDSKPFEIRVCGWSGVHVRSHVTPVSWSQTKERSINNAPWSIQWLKNPEKKESFYLPLCAFEYIYRLVCVCMWVSALACAWTICIRSEAEVGGQGSNGRVTGSSALSSIHLTPPAVSQRTSEQEKHCLFWQAAKSISSICHTPGGSIWTRFPLQFSAWRIRSARSPACGRGGAKHCTRDGNGQSSRLRLGLTERQKQYKKKEKKRVSHTLWRMLRQAR